MKVEHNRQEESPPVCRVLNNAEDVEQDVRIGNNNLWRHGRTFSGEEQQQSPFCGWAAIVAP